MNDERPPIERVLDLALYAPVGVALTLRDELPKHVKQGRQALENRVQLARFIGQLAVQAGQRELAKRIEEQRAAKQAASEPDAVAADPTGPADQADHADGVDIAEGAAPMRSLVQSAAAEPSGADVAEPVPSAADLPISDYESLAAIHVVERLRTMRPDELDLIRRFETAHRSRRTILAKLDQLLDQLHGR